MRGLILLALAGCVLPLTGCFANTAATAPTDMPSLDATASPFCAAYVDWVDNELDGNQQLVAADLDQTGLAELAASVSTLQTQLPADAPERVSEATEALIQLTVDQQDPDSWSETQEDVLTNGVSEIVTYGNKTCIE